MIVRHEIFRGMINNLYYKMFFFRKTSLLYFNILKIRMCQSVKNNEQRQGRLRGQRLSSIGSILFNNIMLCEP